MKRKILLVDDDASLLATLGDFLENEGYQVSKAESGEEAMAILSAVRPDLIVLDMSMPGMGGMGVLDRLTRHDGSLRYPVLVLTARATMAEYFADKQVDGFIAKPCDPEDLLLEISRILFQRGSDAAAVVASQARTVVLLGDSDKTRHTAMRQALTDAGFEVTGIFRGPDLLEAAILEPPAAIVMRLEMDGQSADSILPLLAQMNSTRAVPVVVYGLGAPDARIEHVAALDDQRCLALSSDLPESVVTAVRKVLAENATA
ncbi:MAG: response regulator [Kiritimatiellae bacterium]|nr:response regulator [Kiritimatiellia bacterium]